MKFTVSNEFGAYLAMTGLLLTALVKFILIMMRAMLRAVLFVVVLIILVRGLGCLGWI